MPVRFPPPWSSFSPPSPSFSHPCGRVLRTGGGDDEREGGGGPPEQQPSQHRPDDVRQRGRRLPPGHELGHLLL
eukprot:1670899-Pyramimonas_sp.AAC.2